jgi:chromosome segregation ATPase
LEFSDIAKEKEFDDGKAYSTIHGQDITSKSPLSESTTTIMDSVTTTTQSSTSKSSNNLSDPPVVRQGEFVLPSAALDKELLAMEPSATLVDRIVTLAELYLSREQHFAAILRQKETALLNESEKAAMLVSQLGAQTTALDNHSRRISVLTRSESELKAQVRQYVDKFRQVEETLGKSNDLFSTFRAEMEQMGAKLARLERENAQLNSKCATLSRNIIEMADERTKQNAALETIKGQKAKLEGLCRTLQAERNAAAKTCPHGSETAQGQESQTDLTEPPVTTASNQ